VIKFHCPNCKQKLGVPDEYVGRRIRCNKCSEPTVVPKPAPAESNPQPTAAPVAAPATTPPKPPQATIQLQQPTQPKPQPQLDELDFVVDDNLPPVDPNSEAIRLAGQQRFNQMKVSRPAGKSSSSGSGRRTIGATELAKGMGKIPLSLATSFACMAAVIVLWVVIAKITGFIIGFVVIAVPVAGAWGLTRFTEHRGIMLGLLAAILGFAGMTLGHVAVGKWVVMPMLEKDKDYSSARDKLLTNINKSLTTLPSDPNAIQDMADDDEEMFYIAGWDLVQTGKMDKNIFDQMYRLLEGDKTQPEKLPENVKTAYDQTEKHLESWNDNQRLAALKKHFNPMQQNCKEFIQTKTQTSATAVTFIIAFFASFGLLDLVWYPMGLWGAFKLAAAIGGEE
jgi:hypothetical protein